MCSHVHGKATGTAAASAAAHLSAMPWRRCPTASMAS